MEWLALDFTKGEVGWLCFVDLGLQVFRRYRVSNIVFFFFFFLSGFGLSKNTIRILAQEKTKKTLKPKKLSS